MAETHERQDRAHRHVLSTTMQSSNVVTAGRTYLDLITSNVPKAAPAPPKPPKSKRERAAENWLLLVSLVDVGVGRTAAQARYLGSSHICVSPSFFS
jgi:hypothetical protein